MALTPNNENKGNNKARPPVVVVVGHVDHGKTTLLDYIRKANVAAREAGGITQAVGSYEVEHNDRKITFIDTPGHEAFGAMREKGAAIADLAILVVAADEGVKPQTKEAVEILNSTKTPFIVALNKIDKLSDRGGSHGLDKAKGDLASVGVLLEGFGGQVSWHGISAKTGEGVDELLDLLLLTADLENLTYDPAAPGSGFILETRRDPRRGIEAMIVIKDGVVRSGDAIKTRGENGKVIGGKIKILENFRGEKSAELSPSSPASVIGFEALPVAGEEFITGAGELGAARGKNLGAAAGSAATGVGRASNGSSGATGGAVSRRNKAAVLNLSIKAADAGSLDALRNIVNSVKKPDGALIDIIEEAVGDITDGDIKHAAATGATVIGFKNKVEKGARVLADAQKVTVITSDIVYDLGDAVAEFLQNAAGGGPVAEFEILAIFNSEKLDKQLVGGKVVKGNIRERMQFEIARTGDSLGSSEVHGIGRVANLREKKTEISEAREGMEVGALVSANIEIKAGDKLFFIKA